MGEDRERSDGQAGAEWSRETVVRDWPWPAAVSRDREPLEFFWRLEIDASRDQVWRELMDTSRLNRAIGLSAMEFYESGSELHGRGRPGGFEHRWIELPWNWVTGRLIMAERSYSAGFAHHARVRYDLVPRGDKVVFTGYFGFIPRNWLYGLLLRVGMQSLRSRFVRVLQGIAKGETALVAEAEPATRLAPAVESRVAAIAESLEERGVPKEGLEHLVGLVRRGDDVDVHRLQVRKLAHRWSLPEREVLHLFLHATRLGLLELSWDVICPHCRGVREELSNLGAVPTTASCAPCALEFGTDGANAIEITFRIHPSIRQVPKQMFCSAQTVERRHVKVQQVLTGGEERVVETALPAGRYRLRMAGSERYADLEVVEGAADEAVAWSAFEGLEELRRAPAPVLRLVNDGASAATFIVEDVNWVDDALRPGQLFCFQGFRDLFSEQYIGAGVHLSIGEQVIMFTDIVGSTRLYLERGDPTAFMTVREHFAAVFEVVSRYEGVVVKTIGDATMAAFSDTVQAVRAAAALHAHFPPEPAGDVTLRVSMNTGVCIAVNLNSNIDYFGNTVNVAAKLQLLGGAGDVVLSSTAWEAPGVRDLAEREGMTFEPVTLELEALGAPMLAHRWSTQARAVGRRAGD